MNLAEKKKNIREILSPLSHYLEKVDNEIRSQLVTGVGLIDSSSLYLFLKGGKKIRASMVVLTGGLREEIPEGLIKLAAATEIVHAATLIHDDIVDQSILRRGNISVSEKWGNKIAVLVGDYMYTTALNTALNDGDPKIFPAMVEGTRDMVKGELYQLEYSNIDSITEEHYFTIIELKTARFMGSCAKLGAIKAGFNDTEIGLLYNFGLNLGYAFQIVDDTLDLVDENTTGKDLGNDYKDGKITLPFLHFLKNASVDRTRLVKKYFEEPDNSKWDTVREMLEESTSLDYALEVARRYINEALENLGSFEMTPYKQVLIDLSEFIIDRNF